MRTRRNPSRSERRGGAMLLSMILAPSIVMLAVGAAALQPSWWVVGIAVAVEVAVIVGGVVWILPLLEAGGTPDEVAPESAEHGGTVIPIAGRVADVDNRRVDDEPPAHTPDHTPHIAA